MSIKMPVLDKSFDYENSFYLSASPRRISKFIAHLELYKMALGTAGAIVECGVFKGASFARWAKFRNLYATENSQKIIGFDTFATFPETDFEPDNKRREQFINSAGDQSISTSQLNEVLQWHNLGKNIELVEGNILETLPAYIEKNPEFRIALLNIDVDVYEPTKAVLDYLYPCVSPGGVVLLDDYGVFPGATRAVEESLGGLVDKICKLPFAPTPSYFIKK